LSRREFLRTSVTLTASGAAAAALARGRLAAGEAEDEPDEETKTAPNPTDLVPLGKTGEKICRIGLGTGSNSGDVQRELGQEGFTRLIRHGYDRGIRFVDTADMYKIHEWVARAIKGLPREKLWIQTKMRWEPQFIAEGAWKCLDRFRKELDTDYIDSLLIHCATTPNWPEELKAMRDVFDEAKEKKLIRVKGVSCHGLPALRAATKSDWVEVHLCRVNPQGRHVDGITGRWSEPGKTEEAFAEIRAMRGKGRGVIGMKIIGNGDFKKPEDREQSIRFAMQSRLVDAVVIGCKSPAEIDEALERMQRALAAG
jgi:predicted aldo/keto reductase-like oxidoreductase